MKTKHAKKLLNGQGKLYPVPVNFLASISENKYTPFSILLDKNTKDVYNVTFQENVSPEEEEQLARRILTLGCVGLHCPQQVNKRHFLLLQHAAFQPESGVDAPIPFSQPQSQPKRKLPPRLQAAAVISLGKLSVQHEEMAKRVYVFKIDQFSVA
jgi:hypothetical protein